IIVPTEVPNNNDKTQAKIHTTSKKYYDGTYSNNRNEIYSISTNDLARLVKAPDNKNITHMQRILLSAKPVNRACNLSLNVPLKEIKVTNNTSNIQKTLLMA